VRTGAAVILCAALAVAIGVAQPQPAPRWPDGRVRLGPARAGASGYWASPSVGTLVEARPSPASRGTAVTVNPVKIADSGLLANLADVDRVAPFLPWSKAVFLYRQQTKLKEDPVNRCLPPGGPRQFQTAQGFQIVEQRDLGRILVLHGGGNRNWRVIHTDGRPLGASAEAVPSYYGSSVGAWEGDTLVVRSVGYNERFWMSNNGLPHTEALQLTERFIRADLSTLRYEVTIDDPRTYTRPWTSGWSLRWVDGTEMPEYFCEGDRP
jgi:hypothetical protein